MVDDTMDTLDEGEDELEEEAEGEVEKVLFEITAGKLGQAGKAGTELPVGPFPPLPCRVRRNLLRTIVLRGS